MKRKSNRIAIVSDIHGNSLAFKEVLFDIKSKGIKTIINLGDSLYGPMDPKGTYELLIENEVISILGNQDRFILENLDLKSDFITMEYVKTQINDDAVEWLKKLPFSLVFDEEIYCCHASPQSDSSYLLECLKPDHVALKDNHEIENLLLEIKQRIIVCGHSHIPRIVETDNKTVINPGSVGLQAYDDELPIPHKMENHSTHAKYSVLNYNDNALNINHISVSYDYEKAAEMALENNRPDWAKWIKTGRV